MYGVLDPSPGWGVGFCIPVLTAVWGSAPGSWLGCGVLDQRIDCCMGFWTRLLVGVLEPGTGWSVGFWIRVLIAIWGSVPRS